VVMLGSTESTWRQKLEEHHHDHKMLITWLSVGVNSEFCLFVVSGAVSSSDCIASNDGMINE
jgi:hypothetical protein